MNIFFITSCKKDNDNPTRDSFDKCYMPLVEIKDFNALIENKPFFDQPVKTNKERMKSLLKCQEMMAIHRKLIRIFASSELS